MIDFRNTSHILFFAILLPLLSFIIGWVGAQLLPDAPFWMETLSPLAAYGLLFGAFDRYIWHWPIFSMLGIVTTPDVRGRWLGEQVSSFRDKNGKNRRLRVILEISQTFSNIQATTYYHRWQSVHTAANCVKIDNQPVILILFESEPKANYDGGANAHKGVVKLHKLPNGTLEGTYFNANGNHGEMSFKRTGFTLHHTFEAVERK